MTAELLADANGARVYCADWRALLDEVPGCDALIVDAPYSARTHAGHDSGERYDGGEKAGPRRHTRGIDYPPWTPADVQAFVAAWAPRTRGWFVSITDDVLIPVWREALRAAGRIEFAPVPIVEIGSRVRLAGDGPCSWTCYVVVARPARRDWLRRWAKGRKDLGLPRSLPGAYVYTGRGDRVVMGGKRTRAMQHLVRDYSAPGETVCDPCCGAGSTLIGAMREGRRAIGGDSDRAHANLAAQWISEPWAESPEIASVQPSLFPKRMADPRQIALPLWATPPDIGPLGEPLFERLGSEDPATLASLLVSGEMPPHLLTYAAEIAGRELASDLVVAPLLCLVADASPVVREGAIRGLAYHVDDDRVLARISAAAASDPSPGVRSVASGVMEMRGQ